MAELAPLFEWFSQPSDKRDSAGGSEAKERLLQLWAEVRNKIGPQRFDPVLGSIRAGRMGRRFNTAWAQTNSERDFRFVNMTLDLSDEGLALNTIGWFDEQLEKMTSWLRLPAARKFLRTLPDWMVVVYVRQANVGADGKPVFQGAEGTERKRISLAEISPSSIPIELNGMRPQLDSAREKLSLHIRRLWTPDDVAAMSDVPATVAPEVERWLQPIQDMRVA